MTGTTILQFDAPLGSLLKLTLTNAALTIVTLGIYRFWAVTRVRRFLWSHLQIDGTPLEYTGTGRERFIGFLVALVVVVVPAAALAVAIQLWGPDQGKQETTNYILTPLYLFLAGIATHRARRYRFSRTKWRGIRATQGGSSFRFGLWFFLAAFLAWLQPWYNVRIWRWLIRDTSIGTTYFRFEGTASGLYRRFLTANLGIGLVLLLGIGGFAVDKLSKTWFPVFLSDDWNLMIFVLPFLVVAGVKLFAWYKTKEIRHIVSQTYFSGASFRFEPTAEQLIRLALPNLLITLLTLGLGSSIAQWRYLNFVARHLRMLGTIDWNAIAQSAADVPATGDGLAAIFDVDAVG